MSKNKNDNNNHNHNYNNTNNNKNDNDDKVLESLNHQELEKQEISTTTKTTTTTTTTTTTNKPKQQELPPPKNRLEILLFHVPIAKEHKLLMERKIQKIQTLQRAVEICGCGLFIHHIVKNRIRLAKNTPAFIIAPAVISFAIKTIGYLYLDNFAERTQMYRSYGISEII